MAFFIKIEYIILYHIPTKRILCPIFMSNYISIIRFLNL